MEMGASPRRSDGTEAERRPAGPPLDKSIPPQPGSPPGVEPYPPAAPPMPAGAPAQRPPLADWLRAPRPEAEPGIWRRNHQPREADDPERIPARQLVSGAVVTFLVGWLLWSLLYNGYLGSFWLWPLLALTPDSWRTGDDGKVAYELASYLYFALVLGGLVVVFGKLGKWAELFRRVRARLTRTSPRNRPPLPEVPPVPPPEVDPARWPELRAGGAPQAAERLAEAIEADAMSDVDHARITRAWHSVRVRPERMGAFHDSVLKLGPGACPHPSGARDLAARVARHDLSLRQVRIGTAPDTERNPHEYRGAGMALEPTVLGTSALVVGPPGSGKTHRVARPITESLCLQALAMQSAVVAVGAAGERLAPDEAFDVVVRLGSPESRYDLDLYGGSSDPDEAAAVLAEALVGDLAAQTHGGDSRRAATCLAQLLGPFAAVHGRYPTVAELRELLDGSRAALDALRAALTEADKQTLLRELDAYERQSGRSGDTASFLADRVALLDRPAFAGFFHPEGARPPADAPERRPFTLRALEHPVRVRIDLPERGHAEASRLLARLVLAQFTEAVAARTDESLFACLVLDDAAQTVTPQSLRALQRLRSAHAGAVLTLRSLDDVPEHLRGPLLGAVGCRIACAGVSPWDAERFAAAWGKEWVQTRTVTNRQLVSDEPFTRLMHSLRKLVTGRYVSAESVTVRTEQRERWSASELANELQPEHAVVSLTTVRGARTPPVLTRLGE
ncbi:hypothetical protein [Streptomyces sulphureus]|uniref:hypothetical protein n=1 Tax=Streptomyces sulphureus TaxID=47758 RepID=UPI000559DE79|nr:hypothetical protein [Streptomyces sulphureus]